MTPGWYKLQEASKGSDLGKGKQEALHAPGLSFEDGRHTQPFPVSPSPGAHLSQFFRMSKRGWSRRTRNLALSSCLLSFCYARCFTHQSHRVNISLPILQMKPRHRNIKNCPGPQSKLAMNSGLTPIGSSHSKTQLFLPF